MCTYPPLPAYLLTYLPTYLLTHLLPYLFSCLPTYYLLTYYLLAYAAHLLTYLAIHHQRLAISIPT